MYDIITFGSATQDINLKQKNVTSLEYRKDLHSHEGVCFPIGSKIEIDDIQFHSGGGGTNTATTFALQGFKVAFYGVVGNDISAKSILQELKQLGIDTRFVR